MLFALTHVLLRETYVSLIASHQRYMHTHAGVSNSEQNKLSRESHYYPFLHTPQPTPLFQTDIANKYLARARDACHKSHLFTF